MSGYIKEYKYSFQRKRDKEEIDEKCFGTFSSDFPWRKVMCRKKDSSFYLI